MGLNLDPRQRAMLAEMKVPVWWPVADVGAAPPTAALAMADVDLPAADAASVRFGRPATAATGTTAVAAVVQAARHNEAVTTAGSEIDQMDWSQLRQAVAGCTACGLCEGRKGAVFSIDPAPVQADWLIVGEPPDEQEERAGTPFVGPSGQLLDNMLHAVQCSRHGQAGAGARLSSVVKCRPAAVRNPGAEELAVCARYLRREIALTRPRVIVAMGRFAAMSLLAQDYPQALQQPFGQLRGKVFRCFGLPVIVTYHPSKLLRAPLEKANAWADLCLARAQTQTPPASA